MPRWRRGWRWRSSEGGREGGRGRAEAEGSVTGKSNTPDVSQTLLRHGAGNGRALRKSFAGEVPVPRRELDARGSCRHCDAG